MRQHVGIMPPRWAPVYSRRKRAGTRRHVGITPPRWALVHSQNKRAGNEVVCAYHTASVGSGSFPEKTSWKRGGMWVSHRLGGLWFVFGANELERGSVWVSRRLVRLWLIPGPFRFGPLPLVSSTLLHSFMRQSMGQMLVVVGGVRHQVM
jgi:hypothetical protein